MSLFGKCVSNQILIHSICQVTTVEQFVVFGDFFLQIILRMPMFYPLHPGMLQKSWVRLSLHLPNPVEVAKLAKWVFGSHVGEWSTKGGRITLASDDVLTKAVDITRVQVPPRAPKEIQVFISNTWIFLCFCGTFTLGKFDLLDAGFSFALTFTLIRSERSR